MCCQAPLPGRAEGIQTVSARQHVIAGAQCSCCRADRRSVVAFPHDEGCAEMFGGCYGLGAQGRQPVGVRQLGHPKSERPDRNDGDGVRKHEQGAAQRLSPLRGPGARELSTAGRDHALAQAEVVEVRRGRLMLGEDRGESVADVVGKKVAKEVIVEDRRGHVVARSGSSARDATKAA